MCGGINRVYYKKFWLFFSNSNLAFVLADFKHFFQIGSSIFIIGMEFRNFDPRHTGELLNHMDKQNEVLMEAYRSMLHELQKLQVEEEMLMRKMYQVMSAHGLTKKNNGGSEHPKKEINEANEEQ
ncbi:hypothetical protein E2542_SST27342 [Spatholobus suberectus]|nr:hypothetical protein E2542_SST27342 [Spatholobus suberectus]